MLGQAPLINFVFGNNMVMVHVIGAISLMYGLSTPGPLWLKGE